MNTRYYMVIIKGEIKTSEIMSCVYNRDNQKWDVHSIMEEYTRMHI